MLSVAEVVSFSTRDVPDTVSPEELAVNTVEMVRIGGSVQQFRRKTLTRHVTSIDVTSAT